jgi:hypothetical protein
MVDENLMSVGQRNARKRMAALMIGLYRRVEHLNLVEDKAFIFQITRQHLANALGLSLVHTIKTWSYLNLKRSGLFTLKGDILTVLNPRLTERFAQYYEREYRPRPLL